MYDCVGFVQRDNARHSIIPSRIREMTDMNSTIESKLILWIRNECMARDNDVSLEVDTNLFEAGIVDSAGLLSFICFIEKEFGLTVPDEDLLPENFVTVSLIASYIRSHTQKQDTYAQEVPHLGS